MARCELDVDDRLVVLGNASDDDLQAGLSKLQREVAKNHLCCHFWHFSMKHFPEFKDKVWRWDFSPAGNRASTRLGWRLFAYVPDHNAPEPIPAHAFVCWDKPHEPKGNYIPYLANALKQFLSHRITINIEEHIFIDRVDNSGVTHSHCERCWEHLESSDLDELEVMKVTHKQNCPGHPPD